MNMRQRNTTKKPPEFNNEMTATPTAVLNTLEDFKLLRHDEISHFFHFLQRSSLFAHLREKFLHNPATMLLDEIICYIIGNTEKSQSLDKTFNEIAAYNSCFGTVLSDPHNVIKIINMLNGEQLLSFIEFYQSTHQFKLLTNKYMVSMDGISPEEFICFFLGIEQIQNKFANMTNDIELRVLQYFTDAKNMFEVLTRLPPIYSIFVIPIYQAIANNLYDMFISPLVSPHLKKISAPTWIKNPESDIEIVVTSLCAQNINEINHERLEKAINTIERQYANDSMAMTCLKNLRITLAACNPNERSAVKWGMIRNFCRTKTFVNLCGVNLEGANLSGANLEYVLLSCISNLLLDKKSVETDAYTNLKNTDLSNVKLPLFLHNVDLSGAKLKGSTIFSIPGFSRTIKMDHVDFFDNLTSANAQQQFDRLQEEIELDELIHEFRHVIARNILDTIMLIPNQEEANKIFAVAFNHPIFAHTNYVSDSINKVGRFFTNRDCYLTKSQAILLEFKNGKQEEVQQRLRTS